jgi:hypothetical protein
MEQETKFGSPTPPSSLAKQPSLPLSGPSSLDMYHKLPTIGVKPLQGNQKPIASLSGPEEKGSEVSFQNIAAAEASSTYPHLPGHPTRVRKTTLLSFYSLQTCWKNQS